MSPRRLSRGARFLIPVAVLAVAWLGHSRPASSDVVVAMSPSRIVIDAPVGQGEDVRLPSLTVRNRGSEPARFEVGVRPDSAEVEQAPPEDWFLISPREFDLQPGESQVAVVQMSVPRDAEPAEYRAILAAGTRSDESGGGAAVRAVVGAPLLFQVANRDFHFYDPVVDFFAQRAPFSYVVPAALAGLGLILWVQRRYEIGLGVQVRRRDD